MKNHGNPEDVPQTPTPSAEAIKLAIRDEVEARFDKPPGALLELVEKEVQKRIKRQEAYYWVIIGLIGTFGTAFCLILWHVQLSSIPETVQRTLQDDTAIAAKKQIGSILSYSLEASNEIALIRANYYSGVKLFNADVDEFNDDYHNIALRIHELHNQDNVILDGDIQKFFVVQNFTNLLGRTRVSLDFEPVPQTVKFFDGVNQFSLEGICSIEGKTVNFTNANMVPLGSPSGLKSFRVEYIRKSLH